MWFVARCLAAGCEPSEQPFRDAADRQAWGVQHAAETGHVITVKTHYRVEARVRLAPRFLATRRAADTMRGAVAGVLAGGEGVALDFGGVEAITIGFADELLGRLLEGLGGVAHADRPRVCLLSVNPEVRYALEVALTRRGFVMPPMADVAQLVAPIGREIHDMALTP